MAPSRCSPAPSSSACRCSPPGSASAEPPTPAGRGDGDGRGDGAGEAQGAATGRLGGVPRDGRAPATGGRDGPAAHRPRRGSGRGRAGGGHGAGRGAGRRDDARRAGRPHAPGRTGLPRDASGRSLADRGERLSRVRFPVTGRPPTPSGPRYVQSKMHHGTLIPRRPSRTDHGEQKEGLAPEGGPSNLLGKQYQGRCYRRIHSTSWLVPALNGANTRRSIQLCRTGITALAGIARELPATAWGFILVPKTMAFCTLGTAPETRMDAGPRKAILGRVFCTSRSGASGSLRQQRRDLPGDDGQRSG